jgi:hypothetical protein
MSSWREQAFHAGEYKRGTTREHSAKRQEINHNLIKFICALTDPQRKQSLDQINIFCNNFTRGGPFHQSLATINVGTGAVDSHYVIRLMKAFNSLPMFTSTTIVINRYVRGTSSFAELSRWPGACWRERVPCPDKEQRNCNSVTPPRWFDTRRWSHICASYRHSLELG